MGCVTWHGEFNAANKTSDTVISSIDLDKNQLQNKFWLILLPVLQIGRISHSGQISLLTYWSEIALFPSMEQWKELAEKPPKVSKSKAVDIF